MNFENILLVIYNFITPYLCALLCFAPFRDKLRRPLRKIAAQTALMCIAYATLAAALYINFGFDRSGNIVLFLFLPFLFMYYRKNTAEDLQKLLFVFCMVIHVASIIGGASIAVRMLAAGPFLEILIICVIIAYFLFIGRVINRTIAPRLSRTDPRNMKHLWLVPVMHASIPIFYYTFYPIQDGEIYLIPIIYIPITILSFSVYWLILGMLDNAVKNTRLEAESLTLEHTNRMKTEIMSTISHEARTPLAVLASYAGLVSMELKDKGLEMQTAANLDRVVFEAKRVAELIDGMNKLTLRGEGIARHISLDVGDVIRQTAELYRHLLEKDGAELRLDIDENLPAVFGNPEELTQVLFNILQNARNADCDDIAVAVGIENGERRIENSEPENNSPFSILNSQFIKVTVKDTGTGIPAELLPRVFERGVSGHNGTGLGLPICKEIIESHNGTLDIESEENKGAKVTFTLPIYERRDNDG